MRNWGSGYVTDIEYEDGFYPMQGPDQLVLAATINGLEGPSPPQSFTYCELGCGRGQTSLVLAAVNPDSEFHAIDFHPAHIAYARSVAKAAGLRNITFHERSFSELLGGGAPALPMFDFITMHGVWSWVSPALQKSILDFMGARLNAGGLVYVSYNAMPAWDRVAPLQRIVRELASAAPLRSDAAVSLALDHLGKLFEAKIMPERFAEGFARITDEDRRMLPYLAHEYLNEHWQPQYHMDVARAFDGAKLAFAANADLLKNFHNLALTEPQRELWRDIPFPDLRETLKDFCADHWFRQDVFVRGARLMTPERREQLLAAHGLALLRPPPDVIDIKRPDGTFWRPDVRVYQRVMGELARRPAGVAELLTLDGLPPDHVVRPVELVGVLVGSELAGLYRQPSASERSAAARLNEALGASGDLPPAPRGLRLAAPAIRSGASLTPAHFLLYRQLRRGRSPDPEALAREFIDFCRARGGRPIVDGKTFDDDAEGLRAVSTDYATKVERLVPIWRMMELI
jgi:hypothetical protein